MPSHSDAGSRRIAIAWAAAAGALGVLYLFLIRGMTYRGTVAWVGQLPEPVQGIASTLSEYGLLALLALFIAAALQARRKGLTHLARGIALGLGVAIAYVSSESIKVLVGELRPCHNFDVPTISSCPDASDWSWPSNHATIAVAIALAVLAMAPRLALLALPLAALIGLSRVAVGVHYFHDVLAGALLAAVAVAVCASVGTPPVRRLLERSRRSPVLGRLLPADQ